MSGSSCVTDSSYPGYDVVLKLMGLCTLEEAGLVGNAASEGGIAYVTGTADLAEGKEDWGWEQ